MQVHGLGSWTIFGISLDCFDASDKYLLLVNIVRLCHCSLIFRCDWVSRAIGEGGYFHSHDVSSKGIFMDSPDVLSVMVHKSPGSPKEAFLFWVFTNDGTEINV